MVAQTSCGHYQSGSARSRFSQHLQNARIKLRMANNLRVIPEPSPILQPAMDLKGLNPTQPSHSARPIVKNPTLSRLTTMTAPSPRKSSPLGSSQHQLSPRPGFPCSKPNPNLYRKALILLAKASGAQQLQPSHKLWVAGRRPKKHAHALRHVKQRVDKDEAR